jgi:hypothetical protein
MVKAGPVRKQNVDRIIKEKDNIYKLTPRQVLIARLADLQYKAQRKEIEDNKAEEILKLLSHV